MPHATAAWMVDNTVALSFERSRTFFCGLHILENP
jgi:hypothetical protein